MAGQILSRVSLTLAEKDIWNVPESLKVVHHPKQTFGSKVVKNTIVLEDEEREMSITLTGKDCRNLAKALLEAADYADD
jgi:hypothetical protein